VESQRAGGVEEYLNPQGFAVIELLSEIAHAHSVSVSAISLAWLRSRSSVTAPITSARTPEQLAEIMQLVELNADEVSALNEATKNY
jgi:aryl-alcohol dehydrogenase-like predicted oxidoreductase